MNPFDQWPVWGLALAIFTLRVVDVTLGTVRVVAVVEGRPFRAIAVGFVEILIWITAVAQVVTRVQDSPVLLLAFAAGFAGGNACGILLERFVGTAPCVVRMIASQDGHAIAGLLRSQGHHVTTVAGEGRDGPRTLMFTSCARRHLPHVLASAGRLDPHLFYTVERFSRTGRPAPPTATGWRAFLWKTK